MCPSGHGRITRRTLSDQWPYRCHKRGANRCGQSTSPAGYMDHANVGGCDDCIQWCVSAWPRRDIGTAAGDHRLFEWDRGDYFCWANHATLAAHERERVNPR